MDINEALKEIIYKWDMDRYYPDYRKCMQAQTYIKSFFGNISEASSVLLLGTDLVALKIVYDSLPINLNVNKVAFDSIDEITEECTRGYDSYDEIYFVGIVKGKQYISRLQEYGVKVVWLYHMLLGQGMEFHGEIYQFYPLSLEKTAFNENGMTGEYLDCIEYIKQKMEFQNATNVEQKKVLLEKMFFMALCMKNFVLAGELAKVAIDERIKSCWVDVCSLLDEIREEMSKRTQKDIVIYWLDALAEGMDEDMEYLQSRKAHSYYFKNAYTVMHYTNPTARTIFMGKKPITDSAIFAGELDRHNSELIRAIYDRGYTFKVCGSHFDKVFSREYRIAGTRNGSPCSQVFWEGIQEMLNTSVPTVYLLHELVETHGPFFTPENSSLDGGEKYARNGRQEVDRQLKFYDGIINQAPYRIYMSDHGRKSHKHRFHCVLQVYHKQWEAMEVNGLYLHLDFSQVIQQIIEDNAINVASYKREFVPVEGADRYSLSQIKSMIDDKMFAQALYIGYTGVTDGKMLYIKYRTGEERFHEIAKLPDEGLDIDIYTDSDIDEEYKNKLRAATECYPNALLESKKFQNSNVLMEVYNNIKKYTVECKAILNALFEGYEDLSIALRMGGEHSIVLLGWLTEANRRKIGAIIDRNPNCPGAYLGTPVISPDNPLPKEIKAILLSSKHSLSMLQEEAKCVYADYDIIDIYKVLEANGLVCTNEFYYGDDKCYDIHWR